MPDGFGKYDVYAVAGSSYCYDGSNVLRNRFGITDNKRLKQIEADISAARQSEMYEIPISGRFTASHLCRIHRRLLGDIYAFAGHYRREDIAKGSTRFVHFSDIPAKLTGLLTELKAEHYLRNADPKTMISRCAFYMAELNYIHPFREGNGRAIREFMRLILLQCGYRIHWDAVLSEELLSAMIDSIYDTANLENVLTRCVERL